MTEIDYFGQSIMYDVEVSEMDHDKWLDILPISNVRRNTF